MTAVLASQASSSAKPKPVSTGSLIAVELRKMVNTRAGVVLLAVVAFIALAMTVVRIFAGDADSRTLTGFLTFAAVPVSIPLPIIGILAVTSEWSQRTALTTFSLVPKRSRVAFAKLAAVIVLALITIVVSVALAAVGNAVAPALAESNGSWELSATTLLHIGLYHVISLFVGFAFGMITMNSVMGIVLYFALPAVWSILSGLIEAVRDVAAWLDMNQSFGPLLGVAELSGESWAKVLVSVAVWGVLPMVVGLVRLNRSEIK